MVAVAIALLLFPIIVCADLVRAIVQPEGIPYSLLLYGEEVLPVFACWITIIYFLLVGG